MVDGRSLAGLDEDKSAKFRLEKIGFVFQDYNLLMDLTVRERAELPIRLSKRKDGPLADMLLKDQTERAPLRRRRTGLATGMRGELLSRGP